MKETWTPACAGVTTFALPPCLPASLPPCPILSLAEPLQELPSRLRQSSDPFQLQLGHDPVEFLEIDRVQSLTLDM